MTGKGFHSFSIDQSSVTYPPWLPMIKIINQTHGNGICLKYVVEINKSFQNPEGLQYQVEQRILFLKNCRENEVGRSFS